MPQWSCRSPCLTCKHAYHTRISTPLQELPCALRKLSLALSYHECTLCSERILFHFTVYLYLAAMTITLPSTWLDFNLKSIWEGDGRTEAGSSEQFLALESPCLWMSYRKRWVSKVKFHFHHGWGQGTTFPTFYSSRSLSPLLFTVKLCCFCIRFQAINTNYSSTLMRQGHLQPPRLLGQQINISLFFPWEHSLNDTG